MSELAESIGFSQATIRRDLQVLAREGVIDRRYGGAVLSEGSRSDISDSGAREQPIAAERERDLDARQRMAASAAAVVRDGAVVVLDIGLTTPLIARALRGRPVTIVTANLEVLDEVRDDVSIDVVLLGGALRRNYQTLVGPLTALATSRIEADIVFLSCTGVRGEYVLDDMAVEAPIKQALIGTSDRVVLLAGERKFPGSGSLRVCTLTEIDTVVTTAGNASDALQRRLEAGGEVLFA